jgi:two-component system sensor histidine kinase CpxA
MLITIVATSVLTARFSHESNTTLRDYNFIRMVSSAAVLMLDSGDKKQFHEWTQYVQEKEGIKLILVPSNRLNSDLVSRLFQDPQLEHILYRFKMRPMPKEIIRSKPFIISAPFITKNGEQYRIIAKMPPRYVSILRYSWPGLLLRFCVAIILTAGICYLISRYLSKPIDILKNASKKLGQGQLTTRVGEILPSRKDEIGDLAEEFDKMAEHLQDLIESRQRLLEDISHELRSPLARLFVALEMARDRSEGKADAELDRIELESNRLNELVATILTLASLDMEKDKVKQEQINLNELVETIVKDANFEVQTQQPRVIYHSDSELDTIGNQSLITSAIENCVRNALRYTPEGKPIEVNLSQVGANAVITIRDHGPGISESKIGHIFDPFYRVDIARSTKSGGYGLGLAIALKAIKLHEGTILAENVPPTGLKVTITIPVLKTITKE